MQFIKNGPDIPERLLQAHEEGRVVFFCGAGISYPAGLPSFEGLVNRIFEAVGETPNQLEVTAIRAKQFDTAVGLLEGRIAQGRILVRRAVHEILTPAAGDPGARKTHEALLTLSKCRDGRTRLITTNFDRLFETTIDEKNLRVDRYQAPFLPIPKNHRWDGLVYLHGLLPPAPGALRELERLVLSSGDFGLAYLTERWASRFVAELFRTFTVCFAGYSINDPVLRYMTDALAADRLLGDTPPEMYALGGFSGNERDARAADWKAKNVTPILYRQGREHSYLHRTLSAWAETYRDGIGGKERMVVEYALAQPQASTAEDDFVGRVIWALADPSGLPAKRFAGNPEVDPAPSLEWLGPLSEQRFRYGDLTRFGVVPRSKPDDKLKFSLLARPAPYTHGLAMACVYFGRANVDWDDRMVYLAMWMTRHLDDPKLILWLASRGAQLHEHFASMIDRRLSEIDTWERSNNADLLDRIRRNAPSAIPRRSMRILWRLMLAGLIRRSEHRTDFHSWLHALKRDGLTEGLRIQLRQILAPRITLNEPLEWPREHAQGDEEERVSSLVRWELTLASDYVLQAVRDDQRDSFEALLPSLLDDLNALLNDALNLLRELGGASERSDRSFVFQPSIAPHPQNTDFHDWTALIVLVRDAWTRAVDRMPERARQVATSWASGRYPLLRRLAMFAATHPGVISNSTGLRWLLAEDAWWLWSVETQHEAIRLLAHLGPRLDIAELVELEDAVLRGPPRAMYRDDLEEGAWQHIVDHSMWLLLSKLEEARAPLSDRARQRLEALRPQQEERRRGEDADSDEFPFWVGAGNRLRQFRRAPRRRSELVEWLKVYPSVGDWEEDDWGELCRDHLSVAATALYQLSKDGIWPEARWRQALQAWSADKLQRRSWRSVAPLLAEASVEQFDALASAISWWLQAVAKTFNGHVELFLRFCRRVLAKDHGDGAERVDEPVERAINHPVGHVTQAMLDWWLRSDLKDGDLLPESLRGIFTDLCNGAVRGFRHARVLLAAHAIVLFRVDQAWALEHLIPWFRWHPTNDETIGIWEGFLWSPRIHPTFLLAIKSDLLEAAQHYDGLGSHARQYASFITFVALHSGNLFAREELRRMFRSLPLEGLAESAQALARAMEGTSDQREAFWDNRIEPFLHDVWPKARDVATAAVADDLARLSIGARARFPRAVEVVRPWLTAVQHSDYLVHLMAEARLCPQFPASSLELLFVIVDRNSWPARELGHCLDEIEIAQRELAADQRFVDLRTYWRRRGE